MLIMIIILSLFCFALLYKLYQFSLIILNTETAIEECLDILSERQKNMEAILEKEVFFDSIEVRQVIDDIKISKDAVYVVALKMIGDKKTDDSQIEEKS